MARPKMITKEVMQKVCDELADGKSLNQICRMDHMPSRRAIYYSIQRDDDMHELYARSRAIAAEILSDEINDVAREPLDSIDPKARMAEVQRRRLRVDALKWTFARQQPRGIRNNADDTAQNNTIVMSWQNSPDDVSARQADEDNVLHLVNDAN